MDEIGKEPQARSSLCTKKQLFPVKRKPCFHRLLGTGTGTVLGNKFFTTGPRIKRKASLVLRPSTSKYRVQRRLCLAFCIHLFSACGMRIFSCSFFMVTDFGQFISFRKTTSNPELACGQQRGIPTIRVDCIQCCGSGSGSTRIRFDFGRLDPDQHRSAFILVG